MTGVSHVPDRLRVTFDDEGLVANAGLPLVATLSARLEDAAIVNLTLRMAGTVTLRQNIAARQCRLPVDDPGKRRPG